MAMMVEQQAVQFATKDGCGRSTDAGQCLQQ